MYQLSVMLFALFLATTAKLKVRMNALRIIIICIYWWSGIQKLNIYFVEDTFPWFLEPIGLDQFVKEYKIIAFLVAIFESVIGVGLIFKMSRKVAAVSGICMHLLILLMLSPFGHNWNHVVWPWNIGMILFLYFLFFKNEKPIFKDFFEKAKPSVIISFIGILFGVMPLFNFFNAWDEQLSFKMYSGVSPEGIFYFQDSPAHCIPAKVKEQYVHVTPSAELKKIILDDWIFFELKVPPYKSRKRIIQVAKKLCHCFENPELAGLELLEVNRWDKEKDSLTSFSCLNLMNDFFE